MLFRSWDQLFSLHLLAALCELKKVLAKLLDVQAMQRTSHSLGTEWEQKSFKALGRGSCQRRVWHCFDLLWLNLQFGLRLCWRDV